LKEVAALTWTMRTPVAPVRGHFKSRMWSAFQCELNEERTVWTGIPPHPVRSSPTAPPVGSNSGWLESSVFTAPRLKTSSPWASPLQKKERERTSRGFRTKAGWSSAAGDYRRCPNSAPFVDGVALPRLDPGTRLSSTLGCYIRTPSAFREECGLGTLTNLPPLWLRHLSLGGERNGLQYSGFDQRLRVGGVP